MSRTPASAIQSCDTSQWIAFFDRGQSVIIWMPTVKFCVQKLRLYMPWTPTMKLVMPGHYKNQQSGTRVLLSPYLYIIPCAPRNGAKNNNNNNNNNNKPAYH